MRYLPYLIAGAAVLASVYFFFRSSKQQIPVLIDTSIITRYDKETARDTVIKWKEKIIYRKAEPTKIYYQKLTGIDTSFLKKAQEKDLTLNMEKRNGNLTLKAINIKDSVIKEYHFDKIGKDFKVTGINNNVIVKSRKIYFEGVSIFLNGGVSADGNGSRYFVSAGTETGIGFGEKFLLRGFAGYENNSGKFFAGAGVRVRL